MNIETYWLNADAQTRFWTLRECGWPNLMVASAMKRKPWEKLPPAMRDLLTRKAREGAF